MCDGARLAFCFRSRAFSYMLIFHDASRLRYLKIKKYRAQIFAIQVCIRNLFATSGLACEDCRLCMIHVRLVL